MNNVLALIDRMITRNIVNKKYETLEMGQFYLDNINQEINQSKK